MSINCCRHCTLQIAEGHKLPFLTRIDEIDDIVKHPFYLCISLVSILLMLTVPFCHVYFWMVVWSLRKRMTMEIAIGYNEDHLNVVTREEAQQVSKWKVFLWSRWCLVLKKTPCLQRPNLTDLNLSLIHI